MLNVLVLGAGVGGIVASNVLKSILGENVRVTLVDRNDQHHYASSFPLLIISERKPQDITRDLNRLCRKGIDFLQAKVNKLDLPRRQVTTSRGTLTYDYLIIALGADYHPETVPGFNEYAYNAYEFADVVRLRDRLLHFKEGHIVLFISSLPYKCPPAPSEMMFLLDQFFRQRGIRHRIELTLVTPEPSPEPLAGPLVGRSVRRMMAERGINLITEAKVLNLTPDALILDHGINVSGDLFLGIAPHWGPDVLRETDLVDEAGWVEADQATMQTGYPGVYAVGDAVGIRLPVLGVYAPKAGVFAHYQAEVVARNIARIARGQSPTFRYTGKGL